MSSRPRKPRHCECRHRSSGLIMKPVDRPLRTLAQVVLETDELEALRLCDGCGHNQSEAGTRMGLSHGTVRRRVMRGRRKLIRAVPDRQALVVPAEESR